MNKILNTFEFIYKNGFLGFVRECYYRTIDNYYEKYFGVSTKGEISKEELGLAHHESIEYSVIPYRHIIAMLNRLPEDKAESTLLDYGCGKGRVIISASQYQYKKIIGLELSEIIKLAEKNIDQMKHRKTKDVILEQCDAQEYNVPSDVNIIYFYNPFIGSVLENVTNQIHSSYMENPRKIYVIYFNNDHFDRTIAGQIWLTKFHQSECHSGISCGLYETT
jgi:predicted RNA methylase